LCAAGGRRQPPAEGPEQAVDRRPRAFTGRVARATCVAGGAGGLVWALHAASAWASAQLAAQVWAANAAGLVLWLLLRSLEVFGGAGLFLFAAQGQIQLDIGNAVSSACSEVASSVSASQRSAGGIAEAFAQAIVGFIVTIALVIVLVPIMATVVLLGWAAVAAAAAALLSAALSLLQVSGAAHAKVRLGLQLLLQLTGAACLLVAMLHETSEKSAGSTAIQLKAAGNGHGVA